MNERKHFIMHTRTNSSSYQEQDANTCNYPKEQTKVTKLQSPDCLAAISTGTVLEVTKRNMPDHYPDKPEYERQDIQYS